MSDLQTMQSPPMGTFDKDGNYTPRQVVERDLSQPFAEAIGNTMVELKEDRKSTRLNSSHMSESRMPSSA